MSIDDAQYQNYEIMKPFDKSFKLTFEKDVVLISAPIFEEINPVLIDNLAWIAIRVNAAGAKFRFNTHMGHEELLISFARAYCYFLIRREFVQAYRIIWLTKKTREKTFCCSQQIKIVEEQTEAGETYILNINKLIFFEDLAFEISLGTGIRHG